MLIRLDVLGKMDPDTWPQLGSMSDLEGLLPAST